MQFYQKLEKGMLSSGDIIDKCNFQYEYGTDSVYKVSSTFSTQCSTSQPQTRTFALTSPPFFRPLVCF
jgi:hypothetical protein